MDDIKTMEEDFNKLIRRFRILLKKYKIAYTNYLEVRDKDTTQTRIYSNKMKALDKQINDILDHLKNIYTHYDTDIHFNTDFLKKQQQSQLISQKAVNQIEEKINKSDDRVQSKQAALHNIGLILSKRQKQYKLYIFVNFFLILVFFVLSSLLLFRVR